MNLIDFHKRFPNETTCIQYFKSKRESEGIDVFERLMFSCVSYKSEFKHRIYKKVA